MNSEMRAIFRKRYKRESNNNNDFIAKGANRPYRCLEPKINLEKNRKDDIEARNFTKVFSGRYLVYGNGLRNSTLQLEIA